MRTQAESYGRREFVGGLTLAGAAGVLGWHDPAEAEPPPEITTIRLTKEPYVCLSPQYVAEELLRAEGFREIRYIEVNDGTCTLKVAAGEADMVMDFAGMIMTR